MTEGNNWTMHCRGEITCLNNCFYIDGNLILDCNDRLHNLSRVPGHKLETTNEPVTVCDYVLRALELHDSLNSDYPDKMYRAAFLLFDCLIADVFMRHGEPLRVVEIGSDSGVLSLQISYLLNIFDPSAELVCVCNTIGNESGNKWLDKISQITSPSGLAMMTSDYSNLYLRDNYFDLTIINGTVNIAEPMKVIDEGTRIAHEKGKVLCVSDSQPLLEDTFRLMFNECEEFSFSSDFNIMLAKNENLWH